MVPERLGSFEILKTLGEGGSAFVYAARDGGREVALKVLRDDVGLDAREVDRFLEEAETMRRVQHPSLVPVLRAGLLPGGRPYIAMPRLQGETLAARLSQGPVRLDKAIGLFEDVAGAVGMLHQAGLVHRDIKPENVFWLEAQDRLVLLDLGIARDTSGSPSTTTKAGLMRGTPAYMAPERFFGKSASVRSDVYELALLLYAMLTAQLPWDEGDPKGRIDPKPPSAHGIALPPALSAVLLDALRFDVERRPASVEALVLRVREAVSFAGQQGLAHGPTVLTPFTPPGPRGVSAGAFDATYPTDEGLAASRAAALRIVDGPGPAAPSPTPGPVAMTERSAQAATMPPPRGTSGGTLLAIGAGIALIGALGGAVVVGMVLKKGDAQPAAVANTEEPEEDDDSAPSSASATASASAAPLEASASASAEPATSIDGVAIEVASAPSAGGAQTASPQAKSGTTTTAAPSATTPASASPTGSTVKVKGMSPQCAQFVALMCSPTSGSTPAECTAWKKNVADWNATLPEPHLSNLCADAFKGSSNGLALRRASGGPPSGPPSSPPPPPTAPPP